MAMTCMALWLWFCLWSYVFLWAQCDAVNITNVHGTPTVTLGVCEGDCDNDAECSTGLVCFQRGAGDGLPTGCTGSPVYLWDYCVHPVHTIVETSWSAAPITCSENDAIKACIVQCVGDAVCAGRAIYCPQFGNCTVSCEGADACPNATIHRYQFVNVFDLQCEGDGACDDIHTHYILDLSAEYGSQASITAPIACPNDGDCSVLCNGGDMCLGKTVLCPAGFSCDVICDGGDGSGEFSCQEVTIDCAASTGCNVVCENFGACQNAQIAWPTTVPDATFSIECAGTSSCQQVSTVAAYDGEIAASGQYALQEATIVCPSDSLCHIACSDFGMCRSATIECPTRALSGVSSAFCSVRCTGISACQSLNFVDMESAAIRVEECRGDYACDVSQVTAYPWNEPYELQCEGTGACYQATIRCPLYSDCSIICDGDESCQLATIYKPDEKYAFNLTCIDGNSAAACLNQTLHSQIAEYFIEVAVDYSPINTTNGTGPSHIVCPDDDRTCTVICDERNVCTQSTIVCPLNADCTVRCDGEWSCHSTVFQCPQQSDCSIACNGINACVENLVYQSTDAFALNITCDADGACVDMNRESRIDAAAFPNGTTDIACSEGSPCTVLCNADSICAQSHIQCPSDFACAIECGEAEACRETVINCTASSECTVNCAGTQSCDSADILWPLHNNNPYGIVCSGTASCDSVANIGAYDDDAPYRFVASAVNAVTAATITCPVNAMCDIECAAELACSSTHFNCPVDDGSGAQYCNISCVGAQACANSTYSGTVHINKCSGTGACSSSSATGMHISTFSDTQPYELSCEGDQACSGAEIICPEYADCVVHCVGDAACENAVIYTPVRLFEYTLDCSSKFDACTGVQEIARTLPPTSDPTTEPTTPTNFPTRDPTVDPTADPTTDPTSDPTAAPSLSPTSFPTDSPTFSPTTSPTSAPTDTCHGGKYKGIMTVGDSLWSNESIVSPNCLYRLSMDPNGNLKMYALINGWYHGWESETKLYNFTGVAVPKFYIGNHRLHIDEYENFGSTREAIIPLWESDIHADSDENIVAESVVLTLTNRACLILSDAFGQNIFWQNCSRFSAPPQVTVVTTRLPSALDHGNDTNSSQSVHAGDDDSADMKNKYSWVYAMFILLFVAFTTIMCCVMAKRKLCVLTTQRWLDSTVNVAEYKQQLKAKKKLKCGTIDENTMHFAVSWDAQNGANDEQDVLATEPHETESEESEQVAAWYEEKEEIARMAFVNRQKTKDITQAVHIELNVNKEIDEIDVDEPGQHTLEKERDALKMLDRKQTMPAVKPVSFGSVADGSAAAGKSEETKNTDNRESAPIMFTAPEVGNGKNGRRQSKSRSQSNSTGLLPGEDDDDARTRLFGDSDDDEDEDVNAGAAESTIAKAKTTKATNMERIDKPNDVNKLQTFFSGLFSDDDAPKTKPKLDAAQTQTSFIQSLFADSDDDADANGRTTATKEKSETIRMKPKLDANKTQTSFIQSLFADSDEEVANPLQELQKLIKENILQ